MIKMLSFCVGSISLKKCQKLKEKRDTEREMEELSKNLIINEGKFCSLRLHLFYATVIFSINESVYYD